MHKIRQLEISGSHYTTKIAEESACRLMLDATESFEVL
jgi:hypothetical protein